MMVFSLSPTLLAHWWGPGPGGLGPSNRDSPGFIFGDPRNPNYRAPNHQLTIRS